MFSFSHEDELGVARVKASNASEQKSDVKHYSMWEQQPCGLSSVPTILQVVLRMNRTTSACRKDSSADCLLFPPSFKLSKDEFPNT